MITVATHVLSLTLLTPMLCAPSIADNAPVRTPTDPSHSSLFREAMGWQVLEIEDSNTDLEAIDAVLQEAKSETAKPALIIN